MLEPNRSDPSIVNRVRCSDCDTETFNEVLRIAEEHNLIYLRNVVAKLPDLRMRLHVVSALAASLAEDSAVAGVDAWKERGYTDD